MPLLRSGPCSTRSNPCSTSRSDPSSGLGVQGRWSQICPCFGAVCHPVQNFRSVSSLFKPWSTRPLLFRYAPTLFEEACVLGFENSRDLEVVNTAQEEVMSQSTQFEATSMCPKPADSSYTSMDNDNVYLQITPMNLMEHNYMV